MTFIFDGRSFAGEKEEKLKNKVRNLAKQGMTPKLISVIVGDDPASILYVNLKKKRAEEIGAEVQVECFDANIKPDKLIKYIKSFCIDASIHGIMVQLPLPKTFFKEERDEIINSIDPEKDVDGLREDSGFIPPTAKAVLEILNAALPLRGDPLKVRPCKVLVVGASGFIGKQIVKVFENTRQNNFRVAGADSKTKNLKLKTKNSDVIVSVTGVQGLIKADMVKEGVVLIDVGSPSGDIEKAAFEKAAFVSPVPGGVGPVTISCLLENLVEACSVKIS
jgi:methylenetetrahydrofolate dehydrogenase (NADP+)/methenyltetrahydrofolate cyclohydrolase